VAEGLARGSHSNRSRRRRDAGANSSKVGIPWKIRWDEAFIKPLLISQEGAFFIPGGEEVETMDRESDMAEGDMDMFRLFKLPLTIRSPLGMQPKAEC